MNAVCSSEKLADHLYNHALNMPDWKFVHQNQLARLYLNELLCRYYPRLIENQLHE